jgi:hypothetical protein
MGLSQAAGDEEPAARLFTGEGSLSILRADFEAHGLKGFDFPAIGKGMTQFGLGDNSCSPTRRYARTRHKSRMRRGIESLKGKFATLAPTSRGHPCDAQGLS